MNLRDYKDKIQMLEDRLEVYEGIVGKQAEIADEIEKYLYEKANDLLGKISEKDGNQPFDRADEIIDRINAIID